MRRIAREVMFFQVRHIENAEQRITQARAALKVAAEASDPQTVYGQVMRDQLARISSVGDVTLFHDDLGEFSSFLLHEVVTAAERHGLQYLCDASLWRRWYSNLPEGAQALEGAAATAAYVMRDQYLDFMDCHPFRQTLLCHANLTLKHNARPTIVQEFHLASSMTPAGAGEAAARNGLVEFKNNTGASLQIDHGLTKAALTCLAESWPAPVAFADLVDRARQAGDHPADGDHVAAMTEALFKIICAGYVEMHAYPCSFATSISRCPEVSLVARRQVEHDKLVTNLRHNTISLDSELQRHFVRLTDGTRTVEQIESDLMALAAELRFAPDGGIKRQDVERNLNALARMALLVR